MATVNEEWRKIDECPAYEVSSFGRVRRAIGGPSTRVGRVLKAKALPRIGYLFVHIRCADGKMRNRYVHRLVARAFHGAPPTPSHEAAHDDGVPSNNSAGNIIWKTRKDNCADKKRHGTQPFGEVWHRAKLSEAQVIIILSRGTETEQSIASEYGVCQQTINDIRRNRTWRHLERP